MTQVVATRAFDYGPQRLVCGQVLELLGEHADERLLELGFLTLYRGAEPVACEAKKCGAKFRDADALALHHVKAHGLVCTSCAQRWPDIEPPRFEDQAALKAHLKTAAAHREDA